MKMNVNIKYTPEASNWLSQILKNLNERENKDVTIKLKNDIINSIKIPLDEKYLKMKAPVSYTSEASNWLSQILKNLNEREKGSINSMYTPEASKWLSKFLKERTIREAPFLRELERMGVLD